MKSSTIRWVVIGASISVIGIVFTQIFWVRKAFTLEVEQFEQGVAASLYNVAQHLVSFNGSVMPSSNPVKRISSNYFIVNVNDIIDANLLEHYLTIELNKRGIHTDYDYAIYDCSTEEMVYGAYISQKTDASPPDNKNLPKYDEFQYYFGVRFPRRTAFITNRMGMWIFSSVILLVVVVFFTSTIFIILRQKRLSEVQRDFINNMTHEFKTPLSTIGISADVLLMPRAVENPERLAKYAGIIKSEATRLNNQVLRVLQMAKNDKDQQKLKFQDIPVGQLLNDITNKLQEKITAKNGSLQVDCPADLVIRADEVHLSNILNNLLENAIMYSKEKPTVKVAVEQGPLHIAIRISDNGIGIAKEHQNKVFDKFYRVPKGNIHDVKGFGLGLHYVRNMVRAHKWKITLESELNHGSTFTILIPKQHGIES
ncbi:MAG: HAMP domain-containing histidine kinase [Bacteroidetes bacterium]|jgi:two-component system phosphate regulon sensor histidine kinase PhoR|nr:HAMP domain-containing histidine kinase [Bacteroidota bacterium]